MKIFEITAVLLLVHLNLNSRYLALPSDCFGGGLHVY